MIVLNKKARIITAAVLFAVIAAGGCMLERFGRDAFIEETVATEDAVSYVSEPESGKEASGKIDINTADTEELAELYGIGEQLAERIVECRTDNGRYETIEEIMKVPGINDKKFDDFKNDITVGEE